MTLESFTKEYEDALQRHKHANGRAAATILDLCGVLYKASRMLGRTDWHYFHRKYGFSSQGKNRAQLKAMLKVGQAVPVLRPHVASLPASLTSLGYIARLPKNRVDGLTADGTIHPMMTVTDCTSLAVIDRATPKSKPASPGRSATKEKPLGERDFHVKLVWFNAQFTPAKARNVVKTLESFLAKHAESLGLVPEVERSTDVDMALLEADRPAA
jgi:hypothetical protein